ncbi:hypothetical protein BSLG_005124 [Batrachochytrium salamandrivorans]|nr:hypothetical protein BSLG_005124 [Batrachochytrium salamandrivorans]
MKFNIIAIAQLGSRPIGTGVGTGANSGDVIIGAETPQSTTTTRAGSPQSTTTTKTGSPQSTTTAGSSQKSKSPRGPKYSTQTLPAGGMSSKGCAPSTPTVAPASATLPVPTVAPVSATIPVPTVAPVSATLPAPTVAPVSIPLPVPTVAPATRRSSKCVSRPGPRGAKVRPVAKY